MYVTGTDTGIGKTRVTAALAFAARERGEPAAIVKLVQTGLPPGVPGDAAEAGALAGCSWHELHRFALAADPWSAALDAGAEPLEAARLERELAALPSPAIVEGSGGAAVPLNARESISDAAGAAGCEAVVVVGLRLGCISHALLTLEYLHRRDIVVRGAVLCDAWGDVDAAFGERVARALAPHVRVAAGIAFRPDARAGIAADAEAVAALLAPGSARGESHPAAPR